MKRAENSDRVDDNADVIKKRVQNFFDNTIPVIDYYNKIGKVRRIDATGEVNDIYNTLELGAKGLVLAAETAIGKYPKECVLTLKKIIKIFSKNKY